MKEQLKELVKEALEIAEKTGEFVIEQAPLLLQEFYMWEISKSIFFILLSVLIFLLGRYTPHLYLEKYDDERNYYDYSKFFSRGGDDGVIAMAFTCFVLSLIFSIVLFIYYSYNLIFISIAPKLYLIEYFLK